MASSAEELSHARCMSSKMTLATETVCRYCKEGFQCPDCYFDELSDILEQKSKRSRVYLNREKNNE